MGRGQKEGGGSREGNERKEREDVPHPKLNPSCATGCDRQKITDTSALRFNALLTADSLCQ